MSKTTNMSTSFCVEERIFLFIFFIDLCWTRALAACVLAQKLQRSRQGDTLKVTIHISISDTPIQRKTSGTRRKAEFFGGVRRC